jgi:hypothetical protein
MIRAHRLSGQGSGHGVVQIADDRRAVGIGEPQSEHRRVGQRQNFDGVDFGILHKCIELDGELAVGHLVVAAFDDRGVGAYGGEDVEVLQSQQPIELDAPTDCRPE